MRDFAEPACVDDEEALRARFERFLAYERLHAPSPAPSAAPEPGLVERTNRELWTEWEPSTASSGRGPNIRCHRSYIVDLPIMVNGRSITLGDLTPSQTTRPILEAWRTKLQVIPGKKVERLGVASRHQIRMSLQAMWTYHVKLGAIPKNPLSGVPNEDGFEGKYREGYPTPRQVEEILPHCPPLLAAMLLVVFRSGGLRHTEVRLLKKSELDWENGEIVFYAQRNKSGDPRRVILTPDSIEVLRHYCAISPGEYVFAMPNRASGKPPSNSTTSKWLRDARKTWGKTLAGEEMVVHHFRHGFVMRLMGRVADAHIADQVGHKSTQQIEKRYGRLRGREAREAFRAVAETERPAAPRLPAMQAPRPAVPQRKLDSGE